MCRFWRVAHQYAGEVRSRLCVALLAGGLLLSGACSGQRDDETTPSSAADSTADPPASTSDPAPSTTASPTTEAVTTTTTVTTTRSTTTTTSEPRRTTTTSTPPKRTTTTTKPPKRTTTTTSTTTTTTTTTPPLPVANPKCVIVIRRGDSLTLIADRIGKKKVTVEGLQLENGIIDADRINAGDYLDICIGNKIDDITGDRRRPAPPPPPASPPVPPVTGSGVQAQQLKLNQLFAGLGTPALAVDGDSGSLTEQQLCAARMALNLPVMRGDMAPGSVEEQALLGATGLSIPAGAPTWASRWALIDETCQIMFVGEGTSRIVYVFPTSTGQSEFPTRDQDGSSVFRYEPEVDNGGWHDSSDFPASIDNPLNGNMYKPLYFDGGQAVHGANTVPTYPASHGCVRLNLSSQDALLGWLGLQGVTSSIWSEGSIGFVVSIQGNY